MISPSPKRSDSNRSYRTAKASTVDVCSSCGLVGGADLHNRVWLVHDGDLLYVDRNGNGDLTEHGECIANELDSSWTQKKTNINSKSISDGKLKHKDC